MASVKDFEDSTALSRAYQKVVANRDTASQAAQQTLDELDTNRDGRLSPREYGISESSFRAIDISGDGDVDASELERMYASESALLTQSRMIVQIFEHRDTDGDGLLSRAELLAPALGFDRIDGNRDGTITRAELRRELKKALEEEEAAPRITGGGSGTGGGSSTTDDTTRAGEKRAYLLSSAFGNTDLAQATQRRIVGLAEKGDTDDTTKRNPLDKP